MNSNSWFIAGNKLPKQLSKQEVYELFEKMKSGDESARTKLIEHNIRFVIYEVNKRFCNVQYDKQDLVSIGNIGLIKAVCTFDTLKDVEFSTYAARCIDNEILMFLRKIKKDKNICSLDTVMCLDTDGNSITIADTLSDDTDFVEDCADNDDYRIIRQMLEGLSEREKKIIMLYFGFCNGRTYTQQEIADMLSISQTWVSRLITKIIKQFGEQLHPKDCIELELVQLSNTKTKQKARK